MLRNLIGYAALGRKTEYNMEFSIIKSANKRLCIIRDFIFVLNIFAVSFLVDSVKVKIALLIAYVFHTVFAHVVNEATGIVHTIGVLGEIYFDEENNTEE